MKTIRCYLKPDKEKPIEGFHPWVFSGSIDQIDDNYETGDVIEVYSADKRFLGVGYLNPRSQIAVRMLAFEKTEINETFFERRIKKAITLRDSLIGLETNAYRIIHSEGDFLPGLIVDRYGDFLAVQFLTAGMERFKKIIVEILQRLLSPRGIYEKDDNEYRDYEGLDQRVGPLAGEAPADFVRIKENGIEFIVDIHGGQKTGFFLDQRENRELIGNFSRGRRVLNCFGYTGGFSVYALKGGASESVIVDSSEAALNIARENMKLNGLAFEESAMVREDVFQYLRNMRQEFDLIILDPPAFCKNKSQIIQSSRGYKDINLQALKRLAPNGYLYTASCSSYIDPDLFQKIVFAAAKDARRKLRIIRKTSHPVDHPINIFHPEGEYLKGMLCVAD